MSNLRADCELVAKKLNYFGYSTDYSESKECLFIEVERTPEGKWRRLDEWLLTGNGMLEAIEAMRERGYICQIHFDQTEFAGEVAQVTAGFTHGIWHRAVAETGPEAVIKSIAEALRDE